MEPHWARSRLVGIFSNLIRQQRKYKGKNELQYSIGIFPMISLVLCGSILLNGFWTSFFFALKSKKFKLKSQIYSYCPLTQSFTFFWYLKLCRINISIIKLTFCTGLLFRGLVVAGVTTQPKQGRQAVPSANEQSVYFK
jgi:hypothetical protein